MEKIDLYKNSLEGLNYKIKKYRTKSLQNENHEKRLMYYITQNQTINPLINNIQEGGSKDKIRKGPIQSATLYKIGTKKSGNDGNKWIVTETSNGIKRWKIYSKNQNCNVDCKSKSKSKSRQRSKSITKYMKKYNKCKNDQIKKYESTSNTNSFIWAKNLTSKPMEYLIHDNGGRPFKFIATKNNIDIFTFKDTKSLDFSDYEEPIYDVHLLSIKKFIGFWIGIDTGYDNCYFRLKPKEFDGNSILIQETKTSYISVGWYVYRFTTDEVILDYMSPVGGSDVPYPIAYSEHYVYFMLDNMYVKKDELNTDPTPINAQNMYSEFYGHIFPENQKKFKKIKMKNKKILIKRR